MRVLAVGAHPDDLEILCAGTLAKYVRLGHEVVMCHVSNGDKGHFHIPPQELGQTRDREAEEAARVIGAEVIAMGFHDGEIYNDKENRLRFIDVVRQARPDVVITHHPEDYFCDHTVTSQLVLDATFLATVPHFKTENPALEKIPPVYFMDTLVGVNFQPTDYVDISETIEIKLLMLTKHQSQLTWLREHDNVDIVNLVTTVARFRGYQCGVQYAEAFSRYQVWGRIQPGGLLPQLGLESRL